MAHRPFRFGVNVYGAADGKEWIAKARRLEALGYDTLFVADHVGTFPAIAGMTAAATATRTLRIGGYVLANDFRHPLVLARELAAIDTISEGRLICGLGTGFWRPDYEQSGIVLDSPATRVARLEETVQIITGLFTTESFSFAGHYYTIRDVSLAPMPFQKPHPPLLLGGGSPRILTLAGRMADIVSINIRTTREGSLDPESISPTATAEKIAVVQAAAGERWGSIELSLLSNFVSVTDDPSTAVRQIADGWNAAGVPITPDQLLASPYTLTGTVDQLVEAVQQLREKYGFSFIVIGDDQTEAFAPVIARLAGR